MSCTKHGAGAAAAFLAFFIIFMAFMALGILKIERIEKPAKPLISQADQRINNTPIDCQHINHRIANDWKESESMLLFLQ